MSNNELTAESDRLNKIIVAARRMKSSEAVVILRPEVVGCDGDHKAAGIRQIENRIASLNRRIAASNAPIVTTAVSRRKSQIRAPPKMPKNQASREVLTIAGHHPIELQPQRFKEANKACHTTATSPLVGGVFSWFHGFTSVSSSAVAGSGVCTSTITQLPMNGFRDFSLDCPHNFSKRVPSPLILNSAILLLPTTRPTANLTQSPPRPTK